MLRKLLRKEQRVQLNAREGDTEEVVWGDEDSGRWAGFRGPILPPMIMFCLEFLDCSLTNTQTSPPPPLSGSSALQTLTESMVTSQRLLSVETSCSLSNIQIYSRVSLSVSSQSPNHSVTPPLLGSGFCLCFSSSMNFSCRPSIDPSATARSLVGKMSGKAKVWPWAWGVKKDPQKNKVKSSCHQISYFKSSSVWKMCQFLLFSNITDPFGIQDTLHLYSTNTLSLWHSGSPTHSHMESLISLHFSSPDLFRGKGWYPLFIPYQHISGRG